MSEPKYEERYCAFVDILGFADLIADIRSGKVKFDSIRSLLQRIHAPRESMAVVLGDMDFQAQSISDAITISTRLTVSGLSVLIDTVEQLALEALHGVILPEAQSVAAFCITTIRQYSAKLS